ncbi:MAG: DUF6930 domain-containing protein [Chloroflexota bacterium]
MKEATTSLDDWRALYAAAVEFKKIEPWLWMKETDVFGVANRQDGRIGYCCIMGEIGQLFGMAVYRGTEGLRVHDRIRKGEIKPGDPEVIYIQDALLVSFDDREDLEKEDRQLIKDLALKFRGRNSWPVFRDHKPGYFPWFLDRNGVLWMTDALHQATEVSLRARDNEQLLKPPKKGLYLVRVPVIEGSAVDWKNEWREPAPLAKARPEPVPVDELRLRRLRQTARRTEARWEVDFFHVPTPVLEGDRPFFPYVMMVVDSESGLILEMHLTSTDKSRKVFGERFVSCIEDTLAIPREIVVSKHEVEEVLGPWLSMLNVQLHVVKKLKTTDRARKELERHLGST